MPYRRWLVVVEQMPTEDNIGLARRLWLIDLESGSHGAAVEVHTVDELFATLLIEHASQPETRTVQV